MIIKKPLQIGNVPLDVPVVAAPMAGITDSSYRGILREFGAAATFTEMISAKGLYYKNENTKFLLAHKENESPLFVQLFGSDAQLLASQARNVCHNFDGVDLNMGCPAPKIVGNHEGSYLLKEPEKIYDIVKAVSEAVREESGKPVTVKFRKGYAEGENVAVKVAKICEEAGAAAITIHGRTTSQMYHGQADWNVIRQVKEAVTIPVIGNGDVIDGRSALAMMEETGCDGVMVGRVLMGNPWVFTNVRDALIKGEAEEFVNPPKEEILSMCLRHAEMLCREKGEYTGIRQMRAHLGWYMKGLPRVHRRRFAMETIDSLDHLKEVLDAFAFDGDLIDNE